jgi:hypothetical protein
LTSGITISIRENKGICYVINKKQKRELRLAMQLKLMLLLFLLSLLPQ